ncbi:MAG: DUF2383 domain-containing protein [Saprospiraceae bacterium]
MTNLNLIEILNKLVAVHNDRIEGYASASIETEEHAMLDCFNDLIKTSRVCKMELTDKINRLGGKVEPKHVRKGNFMCMLNYKYAAHKQVNRRDIVESCNYGESVSKYKYENLFNANQRNLILEYSTMIKLHLGQLELDQSRLMQLRNGMAQTA